MRRAGETLVRYRYAVLVAWAAAWFVPEFVHTYGQPGEWLFFEAGAFSIDNLTPALHGGLQVYTRDPGVQIGPPSLLLLAGAVTAVSPHAAEALFAAVMAAMGPAVVWLLEHAWRRRCPTAAATYVAATAVTGGLLLVADWSYQAALWRHLDDCLALLLIAAAAMVIQRPRLWWLGAVILGSAAAAQPWAIGAAPLLLLLPRRRWASSTALLLVSLSGWWAPFILSAPATVAALGSYHVAPSAGSALYLLGLRGDQAAWLRPLQLTAEIVVTAAVVRRRGLGPALLAAVCVRLLLDPYTWSYYVTAPLAGALLLDLGRAATSESWWPRWTTAVVLVEVLAPSVAPPDVAATLRLAAGAATVWLCLRCTPDDRLKLALKPHGRSDDIDDMPTLRERAAFPSPARRRLSPPSLRSSATRATGDASGFTLIELLIVMIILGVLAAIAIPLFLSQQTKANDAAAKSDVSVIGKDIATYYVDGTGTVSVIGTATASSPGSFTIYSGGTAVDSGNLSKGDVILGKNGGSLGVATTSNGHFCIGISGTGASTPWFFSDSYGLQPGTVNAMGKVVPPTGCGS